FNPIFKFLEANLQKPGYDKVLKESLKLKLLFLYPSLFKLNTALGPIKIRPSIILVKCTPKKGKSGLGTGYIRFLIKCLLFFFNSYYSPLKGIIWRSVCIPDFSFIISYINLEQFIKYLVVIFFLFEVSIITSDDLLFIFVTSSFKSIVPPLLLKISAKVCATFL